MLWRTHLLRQLEWKAPNNWKNLIEETTKHEAELFTKTTRQAQDAKAIEALVK
jgi:hypothetical protein